jgi:methylmalonyl-CoA mutase
METKIQFELKNYNETLIWNSPEDIKVKPFIIEMSLQSTYKPLKHLNLNCQNIFVFDIEKSVERALTLERAQTVSVLQ